MQKAPTATRSGRASSTRAVTSVLDRMPSRSTPSRASISSSSSRAPGRVSTSMPASPRIVDASGCRFSSSRAFTGPTVPGGPAARATGRRLLLRPARSPRTGGPSPGPARGGWSPTTRGGAAQLGRGRPVRRTCRRGGPRWRPSAAARHRRRATATTSEYAASMMRVTAEVPALPGGHQPGRGEARVGGQRVDRQTGLAGAPVELEGEQQVRQLGAEVRRPAPVAAARGRRGSSSGARRAIRWPTEETLTTRAPPAVHAAAATAARSARSARARWWPAAARSRRRCAGTASPSRRRC